MNEYNTLKSLKNNLKNKVVTIRIDANVPIVNGIITDNSRLKEALPSIIFALNEGAKKVLLLSHFGRPKAGKHEKEFSLTQVKSEIEKLLEEEIDFAESFDYKILKSNKRVILFENLRYNDGEEKGSADLAQTLANLGDVYVNDAFSCAHRPHASISEIGKFTKVYAGFLMEKEIEAITAITNKSSGSIFTIVGGSKVSTKISLLKNLVKKTNYIFIAGGMANTFLHAKGIEVGASLCEKDYKDTALEILQEATKHGCKIILPADVVVAKKIERGAGSRVIQNTAVLQDDIIVDAGPFSVLEIIETLNKTDLFVWNGPLGIFEMPPFNTSTFFVARMVAKLTSAGKIKSIVGGGDTASAVLEAGLKSEMTYVSTAGGAFLEWLEGKKLPGIAVIQK